MKDGMGMEAGKEVGRGILEKPAPPAPPAPPKPENPEKLPSPNPPKPGE
jgi:hypothetical protein